MTNDAGRCPRCGGRLASGTTVDGQLVCPDCGVLVSDPGTASSPQQADPVIGRTVGEFEIVELLGHGGMGSVYKARQPSLSRFVAIKILPQALSRDASFVERFNREARDAAAVSHPNIIDIFAFGHDKGYQYIAMEYVAGETLAQVLGREGRLAPNRALDVMKQVVAALAEAHECGILHRDIKPSNILLDAKRRVKVADFGLAKHEGVDVSVTLTGQTLGTPLYMPPEAVRGAHLDARSDLYSLGATFYHAIAGRPPFEGATGAELILKHVEATPLPVHQLACHAPLKLCRVIDRLLRKDPAERYPSARALLDELESLRELTPPTEMECAEPASRVASAEASTEVWQQAQRPGPASAAAPRHRGKRTAAVAGGVAVGALLLLAVALVIIRAISTREPGGLTPMFDGSTLAGWRVVEQFPVDPSAWSGAGGQARVADRRIVLEPGQPLSGIKWAGDFPRSDYEIHVEAMRVAGADCFCAIVFPAGAYQCLLEVGAEGGTMVGLEFVDGKPPQDTGVGRRMHFELGRSYLIRLRVTSACVQAWVGEEEVVDLSLPGHQLTLAPYWEPLAPFGVGTAVGTTGALRRIDLWRREPQE